MLNCYPEFKLLYDAGLLEYLQKPDPTDIPLDISNWLRYPQQNQTIQAVLADFDVKGKYIPSWIGNPVSWFLNDEIGLTDLTNIFTYLYENKIID